MYSVFPLNRTAEQWLASSGQVLLTWSIFNPNGPTINCLGTRDTGARGEREVFYRWLHFLGGEDYCLGYLSPSEADSGSGFEEILRHAFALEPGRELKRFPLVTCIPYVVVPWINEAWLPALRDALASSRAMQEADWGREQYLREKYGNRLFDRAGEEIRAAYERARAGESELAETGRAFLDYTLDKHNHIASFREWTPGQYQSRGIQPGDVESWWSAVINEEYWPSAVGQLAQGWVGAIAQSDVEVKTTLEEVRDFFNHYQYPWWPETMTTEEVTRRMGLSGRSAVKAADEPIRPAGKSDDSAPSVRTRLSSAVRGLFGTRTRH